MAIGNSGVLTWTSTLSTNSSVVFTLQLTWSETYEIETNKSTVSITSVAVKASTSGTTYYPDGTIIINGIPVLTMNSTTPTGSVYISSPNTYYEISNATCGLSNIDHNIDGTKSINIELAGNRYDGYFYLFTRTTGVWCRVSGSQSITLATIPRAASISNASNVTLGSTCSVSWTPASSNFGYRLMFLLGDWSYTTDIILPWQTTLYTYTGYTLPLDVASRLPNSTSGTMTVYLYTYSDIYCSTQIGSVSIGTFIVTVPSTIVPTLSNVTAEIINGNPVISNWNVAVAGYTQVKISAGAEGSYGSTISGFTIGGSYNVIQSGASLSYTGSVISSSGDKTFTVTANDSRGRSSVYSTTNSIPFLAYSNPTISSLAVSRNSSNAKQIVVKANWTYSSVDGKNSVTAKLYYKKSSDTSWTEYGNLSQNTSTTLTTEFEETNSYNFKIVVTDALSNSAQEEGFVSTIGVTMDFRAGGKGLGIGKIAESNNLEIAFDTIFMGEVYIQNAEGTKVSLADYIRSLI